ncbi:MAG: 3'(2'),5'-bisphosphate nucleotidase CysQ [Desulfobacterales bacterium]|nr:3'(2'),5'-bisphosphate nucleotidase CysQ [Desulfobacterales bacterium]
MTSELLLAAKTALAAGREILKIYENGFSVEEKADGSPLTQADRCAHEIIQAALSGTGLPLLSEEGRDIAYDQRKGWQQFWLVDPLDGTKEFIHRRGEFTVNIALIENGRPVMGVVYLPTTGALYAAARGLGAWRLDRKQLSILEALPEDLPLEGAWAKITGEAGRLPSARRAQRPFTIIGSRSHGTEAVSAYVQRQEKEHGLVDFISAGSSLKFCRVAEGAADVYPRFGPTMEWDTAAGQAVAEAAGAEVVEAESGRPLVYNKPDLKNPWFIVRRKDGSPLFGKRI